MDRLLSRVLLLLAALVALPAAAADANWWQAEWKYRKPITVDAGPQGAGLAGDPGRTPLLLRLHTGNFGFDGTQDAGNDLRFVSGDGRTVLAHQIEQFDPTLGLALVVATDPGSVRDFQAFARQTGNELLEQTSANDEFVHYLRRR